MPTALLFGTVYCLAGIVLLAIGFAALDLVTPGSLRQRIYTDRSVNAAVVVASFDLALGAIMATAIWTNGDGWWGLAWVVAFGLLGTVLQVVTFLVLDAVTPGSLREVAVQDGFHPGAVVAAASMVAVAGIVCASIA